MGLLDKLRVAYDRQVGPRPIGRAGAPATPVVERPGPAFAPRGGRLSNGLKDFLWHLEGVGHGNLLDSGPVWQATVGFFVERGFKVYADDLLSSWKEFLRAEEDRLRALPLGEPAAETSPAERAEHFLCENLQYPADTFHAMLIWDLLDYLESELATRVVARLTDQLKEGGIILAVFHSRKPEEFHRYRVLNSQNLELLPAPALLPAQRIYQNREILNLFSRFHTTKTFVGRDQLREGLFVK